MSIEPLDAPKIGPGTPPPGGPPVRASIPAPTGDGGPIEHPPVIKVHDPKGMVNLLDPAVIKEEVERGEKENREAQ